MEWGTSNNIYIKLAQVALFKAYSELYSSWWQKMDKRASLNLQRLVERKTRDLDFSKCIKDKDQLVLMNEEEIKKLFWHILLIEAIEENELSKSVEDKTLGLFKN